MPPSEQVSRFNDATLTESRSPLSAESEFSRAAVREARLPAVTMWLTSIAFDNGMSRVARPRDGIFGIMLPFGATGRIGQDGREAEVPGGDFVLYETERNVTISSVERRGTASLLSVMVPRPLLHVPDAGLRQLAATRLPGRGGLGGLFAQFLTGLVTTEPASCSPRDVSRLGSVVTDLLTAALMHHLDDSGRLPDSSRRAANLQGVQGYIQRHLGDPGLSPRSIAAAHHISVSYLHRLFSEESVTVAAWVRGQRLERARRDLADPALTGTPVHRIAARWGFADHATFTRAFRGTYDIPPQAYREIALNQPVLSPSTASSGEERCFKP